MFGKRKRKQNNAKPPTLSPPPPYISPASLPIYQQPTATSYSTAILPVNVSTDLHQSAQIHGYQQPQTFANGWSSCINLGATIPPTETAGMQDHRFDNNPELCNIIEDKFSDIITLIDEGEFRTGEKDLFITIPSLSSVEVDDGANRERSLFHNERPRPAKKHNNQSKTRAVNLFSKLDFYLNSRLPTSLPPLQIYLETYKLLCLAAEYSASVYEHSRRSSERKSLISANNCLGTKAMVIKSVPFDDKKTIVFAIRGTKFTRRDWFINLQTNPTSPTGFLDDPGNLCHRGFLEVAKAMIKPIAERLRNLLQENPSRSACSLLITGHSAGGAVASLLYSHMLSQTVSSELNILSGCFKRIHCITFGAPPISLLPLQKPTTSNPRIRKWLFFSFMNEGDPVVRAEKPYVRSLIDLLATPIPSFPLVPHQPKPMNLLNASLSRLDLTLHPVKKEQPKLWWDVPPATLSNAGRLIVLRIPRGSKREDNIVANVVEDEQLRQVIFGDPLMHSMDLYRKRIELLAIRAMTGKNG